MAVTKIIPIRSSVEKSIDYICNPEKTGNCLYIHSEHCVPQTAALTFQHHQNQCRSGGNTTGRHLIQSFAPGEVSPEKAHEIGKQLVEEILGGQYAFVMATHIDKEHIHNHFIWGTANVETHKRYRSNKQSYREIRSVSDRLCEENNLSVIVPKGMGKSYIEYQREKQGTSWEAQLKVLMDSVLVEASNFEDFLQRMEGLGVGIKQGVHISFRAAEQQRFIRGKTLGPEYTEESLRRRISEKSVSKSPAQNMQTVIYIAGNGKIRSSPGYRQWAQLFNLKQGAAAFNLVQEYGGVEAYDKLYKETLREKMSLAQNLNGIDAELKNLSTLRNHIRAYGRTKNVFQQYQKAKNKEKFYQEHRADIDAHKTAKRILSQMEQPVPATKDITAVMERLRINKADVEAQYKEKSDELKEMDVIRKNVYALVGEYKDHERNKETDLSL